jgi:acetolactate synthase-1/2/3 large subunit
MINSHEIETAIRCRLPIVILIWNDGAYGLSARKPLNSFDQTSHVNFSNPAFVEYADSFGGRGCRVERTEDLQCMLREALASGTLNIIDCPVDHRARIRLMDPMGKFVWPI